MSREEIVLDTLKSIDCYNSELYNEGFILIPHLLLILKEQNYNESRIQVAYSNGGCRNYGFLNLNTLCIENLNGSKITCGRTWITCVKII